MIEHRLWATQGHTWVELTKQIMHLTCIHSIRTFPHADIEKEPIESWRIPIVLFSTSHRRNIPPDPANFTLKYTPPLARSKKAWMRVTEFSYEFLNFDITK